jgi:glycosyltransferase involved in cell wall biosynthesis
MSQKLPISFIVPCHNEEDCIGSQLDSIHAQKWQPAEIIVPNWSEDRTEEIARSKGAIITEGGLLSVARNHGAAKAKEPVLFFSDADNTMTPDTFIKDVYDEFITSGADVASTMFRLDNPSRHYFMAMLSFTVYSWLKWMSARMHRPFVESGFFLIVKKDAFDKIGGFRKMQNGLPEDLDFMTRALEAGLKYRVLKIKVTTSGRRYFKFDKAVKAIIGTIICGIVVKNGWYDKPRVVRVATGLYGGLGGKDKNETTKRLIKGGLIVAGTIAAVTALVNLMSSNRKKLKTRWENR